MDWQSKCKSAVASAILSWPIELAAIVADYAKRGVRWSVYHRNERITVLDDGLSATTSKKSRKYYSDENGTEYLRVLADQPLSRTATVWTMQLLSFSAGISQIVYRIGVLPSDCLDDDAVSRFAGPEVLFGMDRTGRRTVELTTNGRKLTFTAEDVRYSVSADQRTGVLSASVWSVDRPNDAELWFSIDCPADDLASSFPVAYVYGQRAAANLIE